MVVVPLVVFLPADSPRCAMGNAGGSPGAAATAPSAQTHPPHTHTHITAAHDGAAAVAADRAVVLRYEALGESEAAAARQDPLPPNALPAATPPHTKHTHYSAQQAKSNDGRSAGAAAADAAAACSSAGAHAPPARSDYRTRLSLSDSVPSQLAAINQNVLKENPTVTEELHKQGQHTDERRREMPCAVVCASLISPPLLLPSSV